MRKRTYLIFGETGIAFDMKNQNIKLNKSYSLLAEVFANNEKEAYDIYIKGRKHKNVFPNIMIQEIVGPEKNFFENL